MKVLLLNEYPNIVSQNIIHYLAEILGPSNFNWTGLRYYRQDFYPLSDLEKSSLKPEPMCLTSLQKGEYDFVIFSEGTTFVYLSSHLPLIKTKRVFLDCSDSTNIPRFYWENSELYFKAQFNHKAIIKNVNDSIKYSLEDDKNSNKIHPFSLTPSFKVYGFKDIHKNNNTNYDLYFAGSAWPQRRVQIINLIKSNKNINFFGGLYNREDLTFNCVVPDSLRFKKISQEDNIYAMNMSKICLNIEGNGKNCFRQFEALFLKRCLLTQEHDNAWGYKNPIGNKHCMYFKDNGDDLIDNVINLLDNDSLRNEIAQNGHDFFNDNYHPKILSEYIVDVLMKNL